MDYVCDFCREDNEEDRCDGAPYFTCEICGRTACDSDPFTAMWKPGQRSTDDHTDVCGTCLEIARARGLRDAGDRALFMAEANWAPRCKACHSRKTAREVGWAR